MESINVRVLGVGLAVGEAGGVGDGAGEAEALGFAGDWADKFAAELQATKAKMSRERGRDISGPRSYRATALRAISRR
jgi:hypothetical protein